MADTAGIDQVSFVVEGPIRKDYYIQHPFLFTFRAGFHSFGQFSSLVSGYDKIINLSDLQFKRDKGGTIYPATVTCRVSAFVYNPEPPQDASTSAPKATRPTTAGKKGEGE